MFINIVKRILLLWSVSDQVSDASIFIGVVSWAQKETERKEFNLLIGFQLELVILSSIVDGFELV